MDKRKTASASCGLALSHGWPCPFDPELAALRAVAGVAREVLDVVGAEGKIGEWDSGCVVDRLSDALDTLDKLENGTTAGTTPTN